MERARSIPVANADPWRDYRQAFADFAEKVKRVQNLTAHPSPDRAATSMALLELENARVIYNARRDALAQQLLPKGRTRHALSIEELADRSMEEVKAR